MILWVWLNYKTLVVMYLSSALSTMIIICVTHWFLISAHFMDMTLIPPRLVLKFSLKVHFILCNLTVSDLSTLLILVEFLIGDNILYVHHLGILPQGKAKETSCGWISQLDIHELLSAGPQVVYPSGLNGHDEPIITTLPELLSSAVSIITSISIWRLTSLPRGNLTPRSCPLARPLSSRQLIHPNLSIIQRAV